MGAGDNDNRKIVEKFRAHDGRVGSQLAATAPLPLHRTGVRYDREQVNPLTCQRVRGGYAIFASKGGAPANPDWY